MGGENQEFVNTETGTGECRMRSESDYLGMVQIPERHYYGIQTARAAENFKLAGGYVKRELTEAVVTVKKAAAMSYRQLAISPYPQNVSAQKMQNGVILRGQYTGAQIWDSVIRACDRVLGETDSFYIEEFPLAALQGGAGTSLNMNVNEVLANLALEQLGEKKGAYQVIHPLDTVNKGQSTNDVYPTALRIAAVKKLRLLSEECAALQESLQKKEQEFDRVKKLGRTEMMDAMEITLGGEFGAYAQAVGRDRWRLYKVEERLRQVNLGGTAVGTSAATERKYTYKVIEILRNLTGIGLARAEYPMDITQNQDVFVEVSGLLKALAVNLMKIAGDLRLMASGPAGGFGEIVLPALQKGSTIMPGKVNPVIPEMITQTCLRVCAHDQEISMAASIGNLELNAFLPLIADALLDSLELLVHSVNTFRVKCIDGIRANAPRCQELLEASDVNRYTLSVPTEGYEAAERKRLAEL